MIQVLGVVVSIGLADSLNPSTIGPALYLAAARKGVRRVLGFTLGVFAVYLAAGVVLVLGPGHLLVSLIPRPSAHVRYLIELGVGAALILTAAFLWRRRRRLAQRRIPGARSQRRSSALMGASIMAVELPTAFPYFAAIAAIVGSGLGVFRQLFLLLVFNACFVAPLMALAAALMVKGARAERLLAAGRQVLERRWPHVLAAALVLFGSLVLALGVAGLLGARGNGFLGSSPRLRGGSKPCAGLCAVADSHWVGQA